MAWAASRSLPSTAKGPSTQFLTSPETPLSFPHLLHLPGIHRLPPSASITTASAQATILPFAMSIPQIMHADTAKAGVPFLSPGTKAEPKQQATHTTLTYVPSPSLPSSTTLFVSPSPTVRRVDLPGLSHPPDSLGIPRRRNPVFASVLSGPCERLRFLVAANLFTGFASLAPVLRRLPPSCNCFQSHLIIRH